jgi:uncharacterized protein YdhG (YjbR/CyaY superfamily)
MSPKKDMAFSEEEMAAMKEHVKEQKAAARRGSKPDKAEEEAAVLEKIAEMEEPDRSMAARVHEIIKASAPELSPKLWYGMPAYAMYGKVICFFQNAQKFKARYATLGFNDGARLDDGSFWPVAYALKELTPAVEKQITAIVKKAVS